MREILRLNTVVIRSFLFQKLLLKLFETIFKIFLYVLYPKISFKRHFLVTINDLNVCAVFVLVVCLCVCVCVCSTCIYPEDSSCARVDSASVSNYLNHVFYFRPYSENPLYISTAVTMEPSTFNRLSWSRLMPGIRPNVAFL